MKPRVRLGAIACATILAYAACDAAAQQKADAVRPEVGKPLQEAQGLMRSGKTREAMAKVNEADAVSGKTPNESFVITRMRGAVASAMGDSEAANKAYESVLNSGKVTGRDALQMEQAIAVNHYKAKDYAAAAQWTQRYFKDGGNDAAMRTMLLQSYYLGNDCNNVNKMLGASNEEKKSSEEELQILANCYLKQKDTAGYVAAIEKLVVFYPKKDYWNDLLARVQKKPGFSDRLSLHVYRLRLATGTFSGTNDYFEMAQLALQAGLPAEAKSVVDKGYDSKALGQGKEGERHQRLRDLITKSLADAQKSAARDEQDPNATGDDLVKDGLNYVFAGQSEKGFGMVDKGIKKGGLRRPEDARLSLGEAQIIAGQKARGASTLKGVQGADGTADMARLWTLYARG
jgi:hypothetical protein